VAYKLELPPELTEVHPVFHVSQLQKCVVVEKSACSGTRRSGNPGVPGVPSPDPGLGREVN
jgi:hypothetical protein